MSCPHETFPAFEGLPVIHAFTGRVAGLDLKTDRASAMQRLEEHHVAVRAGLGLGDRRYITAEQVHGAGVAVVDRGSADRVPDVDGLITADPQVCLGIYVADCGPVFLADPVRRVIGCVHSGKKGTVSGIVSVAIGKMIANFGCEPSRIVAQLGPCIRPPHYETDFASVILRQCRAAGVGQVYDCGTCTAANPGLYYSYRREMGQTGRMAAFLALRC